MLDSISVIIPTLGESTLEDTLSVLSPQLLDRDEIIVVGAFSKNMIPLFPDVRFVFTPTRVSAAMARNIGMQTAKNYIFLFTDSDCIPNQNWISEHRFYQSQNKKIVGGGVEFPKSNFWSFSDNLSMFHEFSIHEIHSKKHRLASCNLSVHQSVFKDVGGFDESFSKSGGEDSDWTLRMSQKGYELYFYPRVSIKHIAHRTNLKKVFNHWFQSGKNNVRVRKKFTEEYKHPSWIYSSISLISLSPLIALIATLNIFRRKNNLRYWYTLPGIYLTKLFYCWGAATKTAN